MAFLNLSKRFLNVAICFFGCISPLCLFVVWATTHDIYNDYLTRTSRNQTGLNVVQISIASYHQAIPAKREGQQTN